MIARYHLIRFCIQILFCIVVAGLTDSGAVVVFWAMFAGIGVARIADYLAKIINEGLEIESRL